MKPVHSSVARPILLVLSSGLIASLLALIVIWFWSFRWLESAREQLATGQYRAAVRSLHAFLKWHPNSSEGRFLLGGAYGELREFERALEQFRRVPADAPEAKQALWRTGDAAMMLNRAADTEAALRRTIELDNASLEARRGLIALYRWQDRELDAEPLVWQAYELTPPKDRPYLMAEWFRFRFAQRPVADTFRRLNAFLQAQPDDLHTAIALGLWSIRQRQLGEARAILERVFSQFPDHIDVRAAWAACLLELAEWNALDQVLRDWPDDQRDIRYWRIKGIWLQEFSTDYAAAIDCYRRWLTKYPDDWQMRFRVSTCLRQSGQLVEAQAETDRAEQLKLMVKYELVEGILKETLANLHRPEQRHRMGEFYRSIGHEREARAWFEMALELDGDFAPSRAALAELDRASAS